MSVTPYYRRLAERLNVTRKPGETDAEFMRRLDNFQQHGRLLARAKRLGATVAPDMTSKKVRSVIGDRVEELLRDAGIVPGAWVALSSAPSDLRVVDILEVTRRSEIGREDEVTIRYRSVIWDRPTQRGRTNHTDARIVLKNLVFVRK